LEAGIQEEASGLSSFREKRFTWLESEEITEDVTHGTTLDVKSIV
jgi:hypothetical protein